MKKSAIFLITIISIVNCQADFWKNFEQSFENFGKNLESTLQAQGRLIEQNVKQYVSKVEQNAEKLQQENNKIIETADKIEAGNNPEGIHSNTSSLTTTVNGKVITIKNTIFSTGNSQEGAIHNVQNTYEESVKKEWSMNSITWKDNQVLRRYSNSKGSVLISGHGLNTNINDQQSTVLQNAKQIEAGNPPSGIQSSTISLSANVNGKDVTVKNTIYSTGNSEAGEIHNIQTVYEESTKTDYSVSSIIWAGNQATEKYYNGQGVFYSGNTFLNTNYNGVIIHNS